MSMEIHKEASIYFTETVEKKNLYDIIFLTLITATFTHTGEVSERSKEHAWKACVRPSVYRGFESRPLRFFYIQYISNIIWHSNNILRSSGGIPAKGFLGKRSGFPKGVTAEVMRPAGSITEAPEGGGGYSRRL